VYGFFFHAWPNVGAITSVRDHNEKQRETDAVNQRTAGVGSKSRPRHLLHDAALRGLNKGHQFVDFGHTFDFSADLFDGLRRIEFRGQQQMKGVMKRVDRFPRVTTPPRGPLCSIHSTSRDSQPSARTVTHP
jgi:hypothetical protein